MVRTGRVRVNVSTENVAAGTMSYEGVGSGQPIEEATMAIARVVSFDGVSASHMEELKQRMTEGDRPDDIPASEVIVLHDPEGERSLAIVLFENEEDYRRGDAALNAMSSADTPGNRTSVAKYQVAIRMADQPAHT
jgi:hypothetical protein